MSGQDGFDLAELDAKATNLHLVVQAPEILECSVGAKTDAVTCAIHSCTGLRGKWIGDEALRWFPERPLYETLQLPPEDEEMAAMTPRYLNSRAFTIMGGTSEIQTNILAKSLVGL